MCVRSHFGSRRYLPCWWAVHIQSCSAPMMNLVTRAAALDPGWLSACRSIDAPCQRCLVELGLDDPVSWAGMRGSDEKIHTLLVAMGVLDVDVATSAQRLASCLTLRDRARGVGPQGRQRAGTWTWPLTVRRRRSAKGSESKSFCRQKPGHPGCSANPQLGGAGPTGEPTKLATLRPASARKSGSATSGRRRWSASLWRLTSPLGRRSGRRAGTL